MFVRRVPAGLSLVGAALVALGVLGSVPAPAVGSSRDEVERRQDDVAGQLEASTAQLAEIGRDLTTAAARLGELESQIPAAEAEVVRAEEQAAAARARDAELAAELDVAEAGIEASGLDLQAKRSDFDDTQRQVDSVIRETYRGSDLDSLTILIEAGSPQEYADMLLLARTARRSQDVALALLGVQQADIRNAEAVLQAKRERLQGLKIEAEQRVGTTANAEATARAAAAALDALVSEQESTVAGFEAAKAAEEQRQTELEATSKALEAQLAQIAAEEQRRAEEAERARVAAQQAAAADAAAREAAARRGTPAPPGGPAVAPPPAPPVTAGDGYLAYPVNARVSSPFGYRFHPILRYNRLHTGMDFAAPCGTPIKASADGTVVSAGWSGGYGNQVVVSHGRVGGVSLATSYNHLSSFVIKSGAVTKGQLIAYSGTTGLSTGCHLHFETREAGVPVDPLKWLG